MFKRIISLAANLVSFLFLALSFSLSATPLDLENLLDQAQKQKLWEKKSWKRLIHYKSGLFTSHSSDIRSKEFFIHPDGKNNPKEELLSTLKIANDPKRRCRFPARIKWIYEELKATPPSFKGCPVYQKFLGNKEVESISLLFADGYLSNPASFFGHPLIKLNFKKSSKTGSLLDSSINYGAETPKNENPFRYIIKGVFGGYDAVFTHIDFYFSQHNYGEVELRDIWDYQLKLTPKQKERFLDHSWELIGLKFPYYFFADNCAYRIAEILSFVIEKEINPVFTLYSLPYDLFDRVNELGLIESSSLIKSRYTRFYERYLTLSSKEQRFAREMSEDLSLLNEISYKKLSEIEKTRVLETLINYFSFKSLKSTEDKEAVKARRMLLAKRIALPAQKIEWKEDKKESPLSSQKPTRFSLGFVDSEDLGNGASLRFRGAYYDLLSSTVGRRFGSELHIFNFEGHWTDEKAWIEKLDLFSITALNLSGTGFQDDGGIAWNGKISLGEKDETCQSCLSLRSEGGIGKALTLFQGVYVYNFLNLRAQTSNSYSENFAFVPKLGFVSEFGPWARLQLEYAHRFFVDDKKSDDAEILSTLRIGKSRNWDVEIGFSKIFEKRFKTAVSYYF